MSAIRKRLAALEAVRKSGWAKVHRVIQAIGQSEDEALDAYGRDRVGADDQIIVRRIVAPKLREAGNAE